MDATAGSQSTDKKLATSHLGSETQSRLGVNLLRRCHHQEIQIDAPTFSLSFKKVILKAMFIFFARARSFQ